MHSAFALKSEAVQGIAVAAELGVQLIDGIQQGHALLCVPCGGFTHQQGGVDGVLVPDVGTGQVAVALLKAKDVTVSFTCGFQQTDLLADELEAGQVRRSSTPYFAATGVAISVETMVVTATGCSGMVPSAFRVRQM